MRKAKAKTKVKARSIIQPRRIVQLAAATTRYHAEIAVYAVDDEGAGWQLEGGRWNALPPLPYRILDPLKKSR